MGMKASLLRNLPAAAYAPALLLPFATLRIFASGVSERAEPIVVAAHGLAALAALAITLCAVAGLLRRHHLWPAWPAVAIALWSLIVSWGRGVPLTGLFGVPQSGLGVLWYLDLAIWLVLAGMAVETAVLWRRLTDLCAIVCLCFSLVSFWGKFTGTFPVLFITTAWPALALPAMLLAHPGGSAWRLRVGFVVGAALAMIVVAGSLTFAAVLVLMLASGICVWRWGDKLRMLRSRLFGMAAIALASILPFALVVSGLAAHFGASMRARVLVAQIMLARLQEQADIWLLGLGWGQTIAVFATNLDAAQASLWDFKNWDFLGRAYFHSHNQIIETALAVGLPGVILAITIAAIPIWLTTPAKRPYATIFSFCWTLTHGVWFELIFVLPFFAMAIAALCYQDGRATGAPASTTLRSMVGGISIGSAGLLCVAAGLLAFQSSRVDEMRAWLIAPKGAAPELVDVRGDDSVLTAVVSNALAEMLQRARNGALTPEAESRRLIWIITELDKRIPITRNPALPIAGINTMAELGLNPLFSPVNLRLDDVLARWPRWLDRALVLAPERSDLPVGYLTWCFTAGNHREVLLWARRLRARNPDDPVGLYFEGAVYAVQTDPQARQQGLALLRHALDKGVERFIPLNEDFKAQIRGAAG